MDIGQCTYLFTRVRPDHFFVIYDHSWVLNFYRYKTFVVFKSVTFEIFLKIIEGVGDDANSVFHEDLNFRKSVTFEFFGKYLESVGFMPIYLFY